METNVAVWAAVITVYLCGEVQASVTLSAPVIYSGSTLEVLCTYDQVASQVILSQAPNGTSYWDIIYFKNTSYEETFESAFDIRGNVSIEGQKVKVSITPASREDSVSYKCHVTFQDSSVAEDIVDALVLDIPSPTTINQSLALGSAFRLDCDADTASSATLYWVFTLSKQLSAVTSQYAADTSSTITASDVTTMTSVSTITSVPFIEYSDEHQVSASISKADEGTYECLARLSDQPPLLIKTIYLTVTPGHSCTGCTDNRKGLAKWKIAVITIAVILVLAAIVFAIVVTIKSYKRNIKKQTAVEPADNTTISENMTSRKTSRQLNSQNNDTNLDDDEAMRMRRAMYLNKGNESEEPAPLPVFPPPGGRGRALPPLDIGRKNIYVTRTSNS